MPKPVKQLTRVGVLRFRVRRPFNFRCTFWKPSHFPTDLEVHSAATSWRTFRFGRKPCGVRFQNQSGGLVATIFADANWKKEDEYRLARRIECSYGPAEDLSVFLRKAGRLPGLVAPVRALRGMRMSCPESIFEIAIISLLLQNTTIRRSIQMTSNILHRYGQPVKFDGKRLMCFPSPYELSTVSEAELRAECRLGYRAKYLPAFAKFFKEVDDDAMRTSSRDAVLEALQTVKGVGPYTAGIIASHALRDPNALSLDVWNTRLMSHALFGHEKASRARIHRFLNKNLPGMAGLALLYVTEFHYLLQPMSPLTIEPKARHSSKTTRLVDRSRVALAAD